MSKKNGLVGLLLGVLIVCSVGVTGARGQETGKLRIFTGSTAHWTDLVVAMRRGLFKDEGLEVEPTYFTTGAAATESFLAGRGDVVLTCELASLGMWKRGGVVGISRQAKLYDQEFLVVRSSIEKPQDLEGKTIATRFGSTVEYFLRKYIAAEKLDAAKINIINLEPADMVVALDNGDVDGYSNYIPFPQLSLMATKGAKVLATSGDYIEENCIYSATTDYVRTNKPDLVKFLRAIQKAGEWVEQNREEAAELASAEFKGRSAQMLDVINGMDFAIGLDEGLRKNMQAVSDFYEAGEIDWNAWFDPSVLLEAAPKTVER